MRSVTAALVVCVLLLGHDVHSQIPAATPGQLKAAVDFDVASIREHPGPRPDGVRFGMMMNPMGRFQASYATLRQLILVAYDLKAYQVIGGPDWINEARFDILATAPEQFEMGHTRAMLRRLLESRFGLVVKEARTPLDVYALEVADRRRLARAFRTLSPDCDDLAPMEKASQPRGRSGTVECTGGWGTDLAGWVYIRRGPVDNLVAMLQAEIDRPLVDRTNMRGRYNIDFKFAPDDITRAPIDPHMPIDPDRPSLPTALREQLGLRLVSDRQQMPLVTIVAVEKPSEN